MSIYHPEALAALRAAMQENHIDYYLMTSSDSHASEYVSDYFKVTEYISGCTSDNVILIVGAQDAHLWTDGRYFISAAAELEGTGITLMKDGEKDVPTVENWMRERLTGRSLTLGFDGRQVSAKLGASYRKLAAECGAKVNGEAALIDALWTDRPALPSHPVTVLPEEICGKTFPEKLADLREALAKENADAIVLSKLDDIMWLTNIRGGDVDYNPVALSYALITADEFVLFIQENELTDEFRAYASKYEIKLQPYENVYDFLKSYDFAKAAEVAVFAKESSENIIASDGVAAPQADESKVTILCDSAASTDAMVQLLSEKGTLIDKSNPTEMAKACKNEVEMENIRKFYLLDSAALCKFIYYIKKKTGLAGSSASGEESSANAKDTALLTEISAARKLDALRAEIPGFLDLSFPTIPAYGANAAMAHYAPEGEGTPVGPQGFLLVDSGGQYLSATTDVTRTIVVGDLTEQMKRDFTLVAVSHFRLMNAVFKKGTTGNQLDMLSREPLFAHGLDYNHGTGHGIGYILNVHEGPQRIGSIRPGTVSVPMAEGMLTSDEPGIYRENEYGIRTESITLTVPHSETEFGTFLQFECLTWAPVDRDAIDVRYMNDEDRRALNEYHANVYKKIAPLLNEEERAWLFEATKEI